MIRVYFDHKEIANYPEGTRVVLNTDQSVSVRGQNDVELDRYEKEKYHFIGTGSDCGYASRDLHCLYCHPRQIANGVWIQQRRAMIHKKRKV